MEQGVQMPEQFFTVAEVAQMLRISTTVVLSAVRRKELKVVKVGREYRVPQASIDAYIALRTR